MAGTVHLSVTLLLIYHGCHGNTLICPDNCQCDGRTFDCSDANLSEIPEGIINVVKSFDLKKNSISTLSTNSFAKFKLLRQLNLGFNTLTKIKDGDFSGLVNLRTLDISYNEIETIHKKSFKDLLKVTDIILSGNKLFNVDGIFTDMITLNRLDLSNNQISLITSQTFKNLTSLRYLLLGSNNIVSIQDRAFYDLTQLTFISMLRNPIGNVDGLFVKNNFLIFIELTNCSLDIFPKGLPLVTRFLYLDQNNITSITRKEIERVEALVNLFLSENQIETIEKNAFTGLQSLTELWINFNSLSEIPLPSVSTKKFHIDNNDITHLHTDDFPFGSELETLSIKNNQIAIIGQDTFENIKNLINLYLGGNPVNHLPDYAFKSLPLLQHLELTRMDLDFFGTETFSNLNNLQKLSMSYVLIGHHKLPGNLFKYLTNLKTLDLQDSPSLASVILESEDLTRSLFTLEDINIMDNKLTQISSNLMKYMPRLNIIKLGGNPFHCDRSLLWLWKWIEMEKYKFQNADDLQCYSPPELRGKSILSLQSDQFVPTTIKPSIIPTRGHSPQQITEINHISSNDTDIFNETHHTMDINSSFIELTTSAIVRTNNNSIHGRKDLVKSRHDRDSYNEHIDKILLITVAATISVVLFAVIVTAVSCLKCHQKKKSYNRTNSFPDNDVTFYVISDSETAPPLPPPNSTRRDRGSVGSTRDITDDKVFTFDNDSS